MLAIVGPEIHLLAARHLLPGDSTIRRHVEIFCFELYSFALFGRGLFQGDRRAEHARPLDLCRILASRIRAVQMERQGSAVFAVRLDVHHLLVARNVDARIDRPTVLDNDRRRPEILLLRAQFPRRLHEDELAAGNDVHMAECVLAAAHIAGVVDLQVLRRGADGRACREIAVASLRRICPARCHEPQHEDRQGHRRHRWQLAKPPNSAEPQSRHHAHVPHLPCQSHRSYRAGTIHHLATNARLPPNRQTCREKWSRTLPAQRSSCVSLVINAEGTSRRANTAARAGWTIASLHSSAIPPRATALIPASSGRRPALLIGCITARTKDEASSVQTMITSNVPGAKRRIARMSGNYRLFHGKLSYSRGRQRPRTDIGTRPHCECRIIK